MMGLMPAGVELAELRERLRELHSPLTTGAYQPNPYLPAESIGGRKVCAGCGGVMWWPCATRRLVDGQPVDLTLPVIGAPLVGVDPAAVPA